MCLLVNGYFLYPYFNQLPTDFIPQEGAMLTNSQSKFTLKVEKAGIAPSNINEKSLVWLLDNFRTATKLGMELYCEASFKKRDCLSYFVLITNPISVYGKTKWTGEKAILSIAPPR